jgi:integrase
MCYSNKSWDSLKIMTQEVTLGKGLNLNRPATGSIIDIQPIRKKKDIEAIKKILSDKPRDFLLFVLGINNGLRASDLLTIKVGQVRYLKSGQVLKIREKKPKEQMFWLLINQPTKLFKIILKNCDRLMMIFYSGAGKEKTNLFLSAQHII